MMSNNNYGNWIDGKEVAKGEFNYTSFNPIQNKPIQGNFIEATAEEVNFAAACAAKDFMTYSRLSGSRRAEFLQMIATEIEVLGADLILAYCSETGLPEGRAKGELGRTLNQLRLFAEQARINTWQMPSIDLAQPDRSPMPKSDLRKMMLPLGPIAVFGASNFPLAYSTAGGDTASALAVGCPVIVKSHPMHAKTSYMVASAVVRAAQKTQMPSGVFAHLNSKDHQVGQQIAVHQSVKAIGFTGSVKGGRALLDLAAQRPEPIPVFAEMGSVNPVIVFPDKLKDELAQIVTQLSDSIMLGTGQFCTSPGLIFGIDNDDWKLFCTSLAESLAQRDTQGMLHPNIKRGFDTSRESHLSQPEVSVLGTNSNTTNPNQASQTLTRVNAVDFILNPELQHEVFGPFALMISCKDWDELHTALEQLKGNLTGSIMANESSLNAQLNLVNTLQHRVGRLIFNQVPTGVEVCASMQHGGPYPASTDSRFTAVGHDALLRWVRPVSFQNFPESLLPQALQSANPLGLKQRIN